MGLDMYLYSTGKNHRRVKELTAAKTKEFHELADSVFTSEEYSGLKSLPRDEWGYIDEKKLTDGDYMLIRRCKDALKQKAESLGGSFDDETMKFTYSVPGVEDDPVDELGYWRKEWDLHNFIVENWGDPKDDNLREIYLDEAALEKILEKFDYGEFRTALKIVRGGGVVYYYAWY